ncbi:MAG: hypothetical protein ACJA2S_000030 [Cyclobacteriaceae bacterium]|jgi:hypothetical protein
MKYLIYSLVLAAVISTSAQAQFRGLDKSPMDVAYLPDNFAHDRDPGQKAIVKVYYSRPQKKGRDLFGTKVPYGKVWRTGANEAAEIKTYQEITIGGKKLKAGNYSLFTIPNEKEWTILISSDLDYWGAYSYKENSDLLSFKVPVKTLPEVLEAFSIKFEGQGDNAAVMRLGWDKTMVEVPLKY